MYCENAKDEIRIEGLEVFAYHGVYPEETKRGQTFLVNAVLYTQTEKAGRTDRLEESTNYGEVCHFVTEWMQSNTCKLLEAVAERLSEALLLRYPLVASAELEIRKPDAPIGLPFDCVSVKIKRGWHRAYIALGSNMGDRKGYLDEAVKAMGESSRIIVRRVSQYLETKPYGGVEQEDFLNGVAEIDTLLSPEALLEQLHEIENNAGRERKIHWGPRTLDLDILFYDRLTYESEDLVIPHIDMENRDFVLKPLAELVPYYRHPVSHATVAQMLQRLSASDEAAQASVC